MKTAVVIGSGLGGLSTALRLTQKGYKVTIIEKNDTLGGRLNILEDKGYTFDVGPSFYSMSYEFDELFLSAGVKNPLQLEKLNPVYQVYFRHRKEPFKIYTDLEKLAQEFAFEPDFKHKIEQYLAKAGQFFHDTENVIVKKNFNSVLHYLAGMTKVPVKHTPYLFKSMWKVLDKTFEHEETKVIFSLVAFFLGSTPFETPSIYSLLNYTELKHDGYWAVKGGMYSIVKEIQKILKERGVEFVTNTEIVSYENGTPNKITAFTDQHGNKYTADVFVVNSDAASFRGKVLKRRKFTEQKLDSLEWTLSPFTIYLGVRKKLKNLIHHNYFLGDNFKEYADKIFKSTIAPEKPYYYVNVTSKTDSNTAPEGCENVFILCPVPDLRFKKDWNDTETFAKNIIQDLQERIEDNILDNIDTMHIMNPVDWQNKFNLYRGSGLGLSHGMRQVGGFRPKNYDEEYKNVFYVGASTTPGTGLPMVVIGSKLVTERIEQYNI
jgi:phytoene desaturase